MGWLAQSRQILEIKDPKKLLELLREQKAELLKVRTGFGKAKLGVKVSMNNMEERKLRKNIARIETRLSQLRIQGVKF